MSKYSVELKQPEKISPSKTLRLVNPVTAPVLLEFKNFLSEFLTKDEKAKVRRNLGILNSEDVSELGVLDLGTFELRADAYVAALKHAFDKNIHTLIYEIKTSEGTISECILLNAGTYRCTQTIFGESSNHEDGGGSILLRVVNRSSTEEWKLVICPTEILHDGTTFIAVDAAGNKHRFGDNIFNVFLDKIKTDFENNVVNFAGLTVNNSKVVTIDDLDEQLTNIDCGEYTKE